MKKDKWQHQGDYCGEQKPGMAKIVRYQRQNAKKQREDYSDEVNNIDDQHFIHHIKISLTFQFLGQTNKEEV